MNNRRMLYERFVEKKRYPIASSDIVDYVDDIQRAMKMVRDGISIDNIKRYCSAAGVLAEFAALLLFFQLEDCVNIAQMMQCLGDMGFNIPEIYKILELLGSPQ